MRAEVGDELHAFVEVDRRALVVVITDVALEADRGLRQRQKPALHRRDRHAGTRVRVDHASNVRPRRVDRAVDHVAGLVDP